MQKAARLFLLILCGASPAAVLAAPSSGDLERCASKTAAPDLRIASCTSLLEGAGGEPRGRAALFTSRGLAEAEAGRLDLAVADYGAALALEPSYVPALVNRGIAYRNLHQPDRAILDYDRAITLDPADAYAFSNRAAAYIDKKSYALAIADFTTSLRLQPANPRTYVNRAISYDATGRFALADDDYSHALLLRPGYGDAFNGRCIVRLEAGHLNEALSDCNAAVAISRSAENLDSRGLVFLKLGQFTQAIRDYDDALRLSPRLGTSLYGRGVAKLKLHRPDGRADLAAGIAMSPAVPGEMARYGVAP